MEGWVDLSYIPRQTVTHPGTNLAVHSWELNLQPVDHKSNALTTTPPSHLVGCCHQYSVTVWCLVIHEGLAWPRRWDAFTSEEHRRSFERDIVTTHSVARRHQPDSWENYFSWKLSQQSPWPASCQLPHDTGPCSWNEGAVSTGKRWSNGTDTSPDWGLVQASVRITVLHCMLSNLVYWQIHYSVIC